MRSLVLFLCLAATSLGAEPNKGTGVELDAPKKIVKNIGFLKVQAKSDGPVNFDVEAQFDDPDVEFSWERLADKTVLVAVPYSRGVIRIEAWRVPGQAGDTLAKTLIEVEPPSPSPRPPSPSRTIRPPSPAGTSPASRRSCGATTTRTPRARSAGRDS